MQDSHNVPNCCNAQLLQQLLCQLGEVLLLHPLEEMSLYKLKKILTTTTTKNCLS